MLLKLLFFGRCSYSCRQDYVTKLDELLVPFNPDSVVERNIKLKQGHFHSVLTHNAFKSESLGFFWLYWLPELVWRAFEALFDHSSLQDRNRGQLESSWDR